MFWIGLLVGSALCAALAAPVVRAGVRRATTRARRAERRARDAERLAEIGAMTGGLAHEIKNPLSTIGLNLQLLAESVGDLEVDEEEKQRLLRRLGVLRRETDRLRGILEDFLRYAGALHLHPRACDLNRAIEELADFFLPQAERSGVRLRTDLAPEGAGAWADGAHLKQALLNLMLNAVQVMGKGAARGPEGADGDEAPRHELTLSTRMVEGEGGERLARVVVADTGPGVPPEQAERIFAPYFSTRPGGAGLGLPITRRIVEALGGSIRLESEPGDGARFIIDLPAERPAQERDAEAPAPAAAQPA